VEFLHFGRGVKAERIEQVLLRSSAPGTRHRREIFESSNAIGGVNNVDYLIDEFLRHGWGRHGGRKVSPEWRWGG
jgi:hypothetical protein